MEMKFDDRAGKVKCAHCGAEETICAEGEREDVDFAAIEADPALQEWGFAVKTLRCTVCGARLVVPAETTMLSCPLCASSQLAQTDELPGLRPDAVIPFRIDENGAGARFIKWIGRLKLVPFKMKKEFSATAPTGVYIPYWSFDAKTRTVYSGQAGDYYRETDQDTHTEGDKTEARPKSVRKLRWRFVSGSYDKAFSGIIYNDSKELGVDIVKRIEPFKLNELEKFTPRHLAGFAAQRYGSGPKASWVRAKAYMSGVIRGDVRSIVRRGSDALGPVHICPEYTDIWHSLMLLPVWISSYRYRNKAYSYYINGQTGAVSGDSPKSALKIFIIILIALAVLTALYFLLLYKK
jgi:hypothetical protein